MSSKRTRRDALRIGGAGFALLAGCLNDPSGADPGTRTDTETSAGTTEPYATTETFDVIVDEISVAPELVAPDTPDSIATVGERDEQFVVARFRTDEAPAPDWTEFTLATDDDSYTPEDPNQILYSSLWDDEEGYVNVSDDYLVFPLPKPLDASQVVLRWPGGEHALSGGAVERLARPPTNFSLAEFSAPESVEEGEEVTATLAVENTGDVDGTFVGALNRIGPAVAYTPVKGIRLDVTVGESATWSHSYAPSLYSGDEPRSMTYRLHWRGGDASAAITVEPRRS